MGFAKSADQVRGLLKKKITLKEIIDDVQNNTDIVLSENAPVPGQRPVPSGSRSPFMFVGQAPSYIGTLDGRFEEGQELKFFEDKKLGKWMNQICDYIGVNRKDVYVTNALKYPIKDNDQAWFKDGKMHMKHFFYKEVYVVKPEIIFVMGEWTQKLFEKMFFFTFEKNTLQKITMSINVDGSNIEYETYVYPIYHPAYIERNHDFTLYEQQLEPVKSIVKEMMIDWKFTHLHVHNTFSMKDGIGSPENRVNWAVENGKTAVATSNHGNICDWLNIYNNCKSNNIKAVLGCEFYFNRNANELRAAVADDSKESKQSRKGLRKSGASHFTAFAKNIQGFYNMIKIHNDAWVNGFYMFPYTSPDVIKANKDGIICLSGCSGAEQNKILLQKHYLKSDKRKEDVDKLIDNKLKSMKGLFRTKNDEKYSEDEHLDDYDWKYFYANQEEKFNEEDYKKVALEFILENDKQLIKDADKNAREVIDWWHGVFGDDYYIEIMLIDYDLQRVVDEELIVIAKEKNIPIVITNDSHYLTQGEADVQQLQMLNDQDKTWEDLKNDVDEKIWVIKSKDLYYKSVSELKEAWEKLYKSETFTEDIFWEGINNAIKIVDKVENFKLDKGNKLPKLHADSISTLAKKVAEGLKKRKLKGIKEYEDRVKFEFEIIVKKGFADYFLILEDIIKWTKDKYGRFSVGAGRGSASGSLINYLIEITDVDPLKHGLMFERFLEISRADAVDIDTDFEPRVRNSVIDYMIDRFGSDYVSAIGTFGVTRTKVAIQDVGRVFGIPAQETLALTKILKDADDDAPLSDLEDEFKELKDYLNKWEKDGYNLRYYINGIRNAVRNMCLPKDHLINTANGVQEISKINPTHDKILYLNSERKIVSTNNYKIISTGSQKIYSITLEDGKILRATENHRVITQGGAVEVRNLKKDDLIYSINKNNSTSPKRICSIIQEEEIVETYDITNLENDFFLNEANFFANGILVHNSQHAAGVLVSSDKLVDNIALVKSRNRVVTGWQEGSDYHELSDLGYYKYDILGLCLEENTEIKTNTGHVKIKDLTDESLISFDNEFQEIEIPEEEYMLIETGLKDCIEIELENGSRVTCSYDHKFFKEM